jgi:hypothetical protein
MKLKCLRAWPKLKRLVDTNTTYRSRASGGDRHKDQVGGSWWEQEGVQGTAVQEPTTESVGAFRGACGLLMTPVSAREVCKPEIRRESGRSDLLRLEGCAVDCGPWTVDLGLWTLDCGPWAVGRGLGESAAGGKLTSKSYDVEAEAIAGEACFARVACVLHMHDAVQVARVGPLRDRGMPGDDSDPRTYTRLPTWDKISGCCGRWRMRAW